jgi:nucleotide-binding universal stress UspA family protein
MRSPFDTPARFTSRDADVVVGSLRVACGGVPLENRTEDSAVRALYRGGIIIATDTLPDADGAVRVGVALSQRDDVDVHVLSVVEPPGVYDTEGMLGTDAAMLTAELRDARCEQLLAQRDRTFPAASDWPAAVEAGDRVGHIADSADAYGAGLIVLGLGAHGLSARLRARETALRVIRAAPVPVLAVPADAWGVPHSALVALDFTSSSEHAARLALGLLGREGKLYLAHVEPRVPIPQGDPRTWKEQTTNEVRRRVEEINHRLDVPLGVRVEHVFLRGDPATELVGFAEEHRIQLVAAGNHGRSSLGRLVLGSVSTSIVRTAHCWVLIAPSSDDGKARPRGLADV